MSLRIHYPGGTNGGVSLGEGSEGSEGQSGVTWPANALGFSETHHLRDFMVTSDSGSSEPRRELKTLYKL